MLEEGTTPGSPTTSYVLGDDVLAQATSSGPRYLLADGHGSTRQLSTPSYTIAQAYNYYAYGQTLGTTYTPFSPPATKFLYTGQQFDVNLQQYYLRARYYNPVNGRFNQMDTFKGSNDDPQSLHKYLYCEADPVNAFDPSGNLLESVEFAVEIGETLDFTDAQVAAGVSHAVLSGAGGVIYQTVAALTLAFIAVAYGTAVIVLLRPIDRNEPKNIVYRRLDRSEVATYATAGIVATGPFSVTNPDQHILGVKPSPWISTTRDYNVALGYGTEENNPIVAINLFKVPYSWIDFTVDFNVDTRLSTDEAKRRARRDKEVLVNIYIPPTAIDAVFQPY